MGPMLSARGLAIRPIYPSPGKRGVGGEGRGRESRASHATGRSCVCSARFATRVGERLGDRAVAKQKKGTRTVNRMENKVPWRDEGTTRTKKKEVCTLCACVCANKGMRDTCVRRGNLSEL